VVGTGFPSVVGTAVAFTVANVVGGGVAGMVKEYADCVVCGDTLIVVLRASVEPSRPTTRVTRYDPGLVYMCEGCRVPEVPPSPKVQDHEVGEPDDVSVKSTSRGAVPDEGCAVKDALSSGAVTVTVIVFS
jgi:hypothetical protein